MLLLTECGTGFILLHGECVTSCPDGYFVSRLSNSTKSSKIDSKSSKTDSKSSEIGSKSSTDLNMIQFKPWKELESTKSEGIKSTISGLTCSRCHYSCRSCLGPINCTICYPDSTLHKSSGRCYANELVTEVIQLERWYQAVSVTFLSLCVVILFLVIYIITDKNPGLILSCCPGDSDGSSSLNHWKSVRKSSTIALSKKGDGKVSSSALCFGATSSGGNEHARVNPSSSSSMSPLHAHAHHYARASISSSPGGTVCPNQADSSAKIYCDGYHSDDDQL